MIPFMKLHGAGNDFCLFDGINDTLPDYSQLALAICDRHFGVGSDGIMAALPSAVADVRMVYYNSDGSQGEMCGNGIRCFARFVHRKGLVKGTRFTVETLAGIKTLTLLPDGKVEVDMEIPQLESKAVPTTLEGFPLTLELEGQSFSLYAMRMNIPHCVLFVEDLEHLDVNGLGRKIELHPAFPEKTNVNFVKVVSPDRIRVKTWERGAGRTLACGTGCCASAVAAHLSGQTGTDVAVEAEGGQLRIQTDPDDHYRVKMTGGAEFICEGMFHFSD